MNYKLAFALGTIPPGVVRREPVAYLYNGVRLPKLPEWDKTKYPHAIILKDSTKTVLFISDEVHKMGVDNTYYAHLFPDETYMHVDGQWQKGTYGGIAYVPVWANFDVLEYNETTVYLPASEPIPVYE